MGISPSGSGLGELGIVWVPVALVSLAVAAWGAYAYIHQRNQVQLEAIAFHERAFDQLVKGGASNAELREFMAQADAQTKGLEPRGGDPLGLEALAGAIPMLVLGVALVMFGPEIMRAMRSRRTSA